MLSMLAAYALVYFSLPVCHGRCCWVIFTTLLLPLEVRIMPSYPVMSSLGLLNSYARADRAAAGLGHRRVLFPAVFRSVPDELLEAARIDGAGPVRFLIDVLVPLSRTMMAADLHHHVRLWLEPVCSPMLMTRTSGSLP